jgi:hypothetical protein
LGKQSKVHTASGGVKNAPGGYCSERSGQSKSENRLVHNSFSIESAEGARKESNFCGSMLRIANG